MENRNSKIDNNKSIENGNEGEVSSMVDTGTKLLPYDQRTPILAIGVGGTGLHALKELLLAMEARDMKPGELHENYDIVIDLLFVDGDANEAAGNGRAKDKASASSILTQYKVPKVHLAMTDQDVVLRRAKIINEDDLTEGFPADNDVQGCRGDRRVGPIRLELLTDESSENPFANNPKKNPAKAVEETVQGWMDAGQQHKLLMGDFVRLAVFTGTAGGTGPCGPALSVMAADIIKRLMPGKQIITELYMMTSESSDLDDSMNDGNQSTRRFNSLVTLMEANFIAREGGKRIGKKFYRQKLDAMYILGGRSEEKSVRTKGGYYDPMQITAKGVNSHLLGYHSGARSNVQSSPLGLNAVRGEEGHENKPGKHFSSIGTSELISNPPREVLKAQKRQTVFSKATGLDGIDETAVQLKKEELGVNKLVPTIMTEIKGKLPEIIGGDKLEASVVADHISTVVNQFLNRDLPGMGQEIVPVVETAVAKILDNFQTLIDEMLEKYGIMTAEQFIKELNEEITTLKGTLKNQKVEDEKMVEEWEDGLKDQVEVVKALPKPGTFFPAKRTRAITQAVNTVLEIGQDLSGKKAEVKVKETLLRFLEKYAESIYRMEKRMTIIRETAEKIKDQIQPEKGSLVTPFDPSIKVELDESSFNQEAAELRERLEKWEKDELEEAAKLILLESSDIGLLKALQNRPDAQMSLERYSKPLSRPRSGRRQEGVTISQITMPLPEGLYEIDKDGRLKDNSKVPLPENSNFKALVVAPDGPITATREIHGLTLFDDAYFFKSFEEFMTLAPKDRERFFIYKGDMEKMLPPFARHFAEIQLEDQGNKGNIKDCPGVGCGLSFYRSLKDIQAKVTCCPGCTGSHNEIKKKSLLSSIFNRK